MRRVVVTGLGCVSPLGNSVEATWAGLIQGRDGIGPVTLFDASEYASQIAGEVKDFDPLDHMDRKEARRADRFTHFAVAASGEALRHAGLEANGLQAESTGVALGSGVGGIWTLLDAHRSLLERGPGRVSPFFIPNMLVDMAAGHVAIRYGLKGPNLTHVTACATGTNSVGEGVEVIRRGDAEVMLAGGTEAAIHPICWAGFGVMQALSGTGSRPFDATRDGFVVGEGAAVLVLEDYEHARARGARMYAEVVGYGTTVDAVHMVQPAPDGDGIQRAMRRALEKAGLAPTDVQYINAHGTGTPLNDAAETAAIKRVFGAHAYDLAVSSIKSMIGHLFGAAGAIEALASVLSLFHGIVPPTINYKHPDPECDLDYVPNQAREVDLEVVMSNSLGLGGHNASLIFRRV